MSQPQNQHASKPEAEKLTSFLYIRAHPKAKAAWVKASRKAKSKLSGWATSTLNKEAGFTP